MALPHRKLREIILLILYSQETGGEELSDLEKIIREQLEVSRKYFFEAKQQVDKLFEYLPTIDLILSRVCKDVEIQKLQSIEKCLLRLGVYEILYDSDIPPKVVISEGVRLAKKFSTQSTSQFVNAILDNVYKESLGENSPHRPKRDISPLEKIA